MGVLVSDPGRARRLARVLFWDMAAYAGDELRIGLEKDDLFDRLHSDIERAYDYYRRHVHADLGGAKRIFNHALVDVLIYRQREVRTQIW